MTLRKGKQRIYHHTLFEAHLGMAIAVLLIHRALAGLPGERVHIESLDAFRYVV